MKTRAIIYTRQSVHREESISHELQEVACRQYAERKGYDVVRVETDPGISGLNLNKRKALARTLEGVKSGEAQVVLVWRWSRLSRNRLHFALLFSEIEEAGGRVESALEPADDTAAGRFSRGVLLEMAAFESEQKSESWKEAHASRLAKGLPPQGRQKFGYLKEGGAFVVDPATAPLVKEAYRRYLAGVGFPSIAQWWTDSGALNPLGAQWDKQSVQRTLDNPFNAGLIRYKGVDRPGAHESLISEGEWAAYLKKRAERAKLAPRTKDSDWAFSGLVVCGKCGAAMVRNSTRGRVYVMCARHRRKGACTGMSAKYSRVNMAVYGWLNARKDAWAAALPPETEAQDAERAVLDARAALEKAEGAVSDLLRRAVVLGLSDAEVYEVLGELRAEVARAQESLAEALAAQATLTPAADVVEFINRGSEAVSLEEWRDGVRRVIERVEVHGPEDVRITAREYRPWKAFA